jgi:transcriptional regulator with XRE-family HTH domain
MELAGRLKQIIAESGLSQREFAQSINVSESFISLVLHGNSRLASTTASFIEKLYGYRHEWLLTGEEPAKKDLHPEKNNILKRRIDNIIDNFKKPELEAVLAYIMTLQNIQGK